MKMLIRIVITVVIVLILVYTVIMIRSYLDGKFYKCYVSVENSQKVLGLMYLNNSPHTVRYSDGRPSQRIQFVDTEILEIGMTGRVSTYEVREGDKVTDRYIIHYLNDDGRIEHFNLEDGTQENFTMDYERPKRGREMSKNACWE